MNDKTKETTQRKPEMLLMFELDKESCSLINGELYVEIEGELVPLSECIFFDESLSLVNVSEVAND